MMEFELCKEKTPIIKVIGVGGGGSNAVNYMYKQGIIGVDFVVCNTDAQALEQSPVPNKIQLGSSLTMGRGAGAMPEIGKNSAIESIDEIKDVLLDNTQMVFITAGMGGGTGTGASPIIAHAAKELNILTVGVVTTPFAFEGSRRMKYADEGLEELRQNVDALLVISNEKVKQIYGAKTFSSARAEADSVLAAAAKGIAELITQHGEINVDFADVKTVMTDSGTVLMGTGRATGATRALDAAKAALESPLLKDNEIFGAQNILLNMSSAAGEFELTMEEIEIITAYIQDKTGGIDMIFGVCKDETLAEAVSVTLVITGIDEKKTIDVNTSYRKNPEVAPIVPQAPQPVHQVLQETTQPEAEQYSTEDNSSETVISSESAVNEKEVQVQHQEESEFYDKTSKNVFYLDVNNTTDDASYPSTQSSNEDRSTTSGLYDFTVSNRSSIFDNPNAPSIETEEEIQRRRLQQSRDRLRMLSNPSPNSNLNLSELENIPAYLRKQARESDNNE